MARHVFCTFRYGRCMNSQTSLPIAVAAAAVFYFSLIFVDDNNDISGIYRDSEGNKIDTGCGGSNNNKTAVYMIAEKSDSGAAEKKISIYAIFLIGMRVLHTVHEFFL